MRGSAREDVIHMQQKCSPYLSAIEILINVDYQYCSYNSAQVTENVDSMPIFKKNQSLFPVELYMKLVMIEYSHCLFFENQNQG